MTWIDNKRVKELVERSYAEKSDEYLIYLKHTRHSHADEHIAAVIILERRRAKAEAEREGREIERHLQMGEWIRALRTLHWTSWVMFGVGILSMLIALFAWRAPVAPDGNKSVSDGGSQPPQVLASPKEAGR